MKKIISFSLALFVLFTLSVPVLADSSNTDNGSILRIEYPTEYIEREFHHSIGGINYIIYVSGSYATDEGGITGISSITVSVPGSVNGLWFSTEVGTTGSAIVTYSDGITGQNFIQSYHYSVPSPYTITES